MIRGVIFDLDGTLYRMRWFMKPLIMLRLFPHCLRLPLYLSVRDGFAGKDMDGGDRLMQALATALSRKIPRTTPPQMLRWIREEFYRQFEAVMPLMKGYRPGLADTLGRLRQKNIRLAVLSDYDAVAGRLKRLDIDTSLFDILASAEAAGSLKPSPLPFLRIAQTWGMDAKDILVIGDRKDTDGAAAAQAGMQFLQISDTPSPAGNARTWNDIVSYLDSLADGHAVQQKKACSEISLA